MEQRQLEELLQHSGDAMADCRGNVVKIDPGKAQVLEWTSGRIAPSFYASTFRALCFCFGAKALRKTWGTRRPHEAGEQGG